MIKFNVMLSEQLKENEETKIKILNLECYNYYMFLFSNIYSILNKNNNICMRIFQYSEF